MVDDPITEQDPELSETAREIRELLQISADAAQRRARLPQPLFWSLFHSRINDIKRRKRAQRLLGDIFGGE
ncbi:MAG: hypothetical protein DCC75_00170 [Proteobacteria bacterium]|nr:MAG: hypothetical protein DCC75_00170 [Pseudomonadota bacterium]